MERTKDSWIAINNAYNKDPEDPKTFEVKKSDIYHAVQIIRSRHTKWVQDWVELSFDLISTHVYRHHALKDL